MESEFNYSQTFAQVQMALNILQLNESPDSEVNKKLYLLQIKAINFLSDYLE